MSTTFKDALSHQPWPQGMQNLPDSWQTYWQTRAAIAADPANLTRHLEEREAAFRKFADVEFQEKVVKRVPADFVGKMQFFIDQRK